jgi:hypothetical protein
MACVWKEWVLLGIPYFIQSVLRSNNGLMDRHVITQRKHDVNKEMCSMNKYASGENNIYVILGQSNIKCGASLTAHLMLLLESSNKPRTLWSLKLVRRSKFVYISIRIYRNNKHFVQNFWIRVSPDKLFIQYSHNLHGPSLEIPLYT